VDASPRERELRAVDTGIGSGWKGKGGCVARFAALSAALATEMRADWGIVDMQAENDFCPVCCGNWKSV